MPAADPRESAADGCVTLTRARVPGFVVMLSIWTTLALPVTPLEVARMPPRVHVPHVFLERESHRPEPRCTLRFPRVQRGGQNGSSHILDVAAPRASVTRATGIAKMPPSAAPSHRVPLTGDAARPREDMHAPSWNAEVAGGIRGSASPPLHHPNPRLTNPAQPDVLRVINYQHSPIWQESSFIRTLTSISGS